MPVIACFDKIASVPEEQITDKIRRRVVSGKQGMLSDVHTDLGVAPLTAGA